MSGLKRLLYGVGVWTCLVLGLTVISLINVTEIYAKAGSFRVTYNVAMHGQGFGDWQGDNTDIYKDGTYPVAIKAIVYNLPAGTKGSIRYQATYDGSKWSNWSVDGQRLGVEADNKKLKGIKLELQGDIAAKYDIYVKIKDKGQWSKWYKNSEAAMASSYIEGINLSVRAKEASAPGEKLDLSNVDISGIDPSKPMVALTYDDGPNAESTNRIVEALKKVNGKATFYIVGTRANGSHLEAMKNAAKNGHEIANHTYAHGFLPKQTKEQRLEAIKKVNDIVFEATGQRVINFRPPGGLYDDTILAEIKSQNLAVSMWAIDTEDWKSKDPDKVTQHILDNVKDGDIILLHDLFVTTATASEKFIPKLHERGYQFVTVSQLAKIRGSLEAGKVYRNFKK